MKRRDLIPYFFVLIFAFLVFGRFFNSPISIAIVSGRSMEPALNIGDLTILIKTEFEVGDIVLWCRGTFNCVLHRLVAVDNETVITKGDANPINDPPLQRDMILYKAVFVIPWYIWIPALIIFIYFISKFEVKDE